MSLLLLFLGEEAAPPDTGGCNLLLENGGALLQENGDNLLIENCVPAVSGGGIIRMRHWPSTPVEWWDDEEVLVVSES